MATALVAPHAAFGIGAIIQETMGSGGNGLMTVNSGNNPPGETWSWEVCPATGPDPCTPFGSGRQMSTAGAGAEVFFRATSNIGHSGFSRIWHGTVTPLGPPSITGAIRANELVTPVPGQWQGGWDGDYDLFQLSACTGSAGEGCTTLTDIHYPQECPGGAAVLDPRFTGHYLRVADGRYGPETAFPAYAVGSPYGQPVWPASPTVSAAMVGRIAPATRRRTIKCGPPALVEPSISKKGVAIVQCLGGCEVLISARRGGDTASTRHRLFPSWGAGRRVKRLRLSPKSLSSLGPGRARMTLSIDGERVARRTVLLG